MKNRVFAILAFVLIGINVDSQNVVWPVENVKLLTSEWTGERLPDGRPKVSDDHSQKKAVLLSSRHILFRRLS